MKDHAWYESLLQRLKASWVSQPDKPEETAESTLRALWSVAAGEPLSVRKAAAAILPDLDEEGLRRLTGLVEQRLSGIPLAHLTHRQHFMGLEFLAGPEALIPRAETEILARAALAKASALAGARGSITILDVCTGAGNVGLALAALEPRCRLFASDISSAAIELAQKNALHLGLDGRAEFRLSDMFSAFESEEFIGKIDLLTCNPPYISSAKVTTMSPEISQNEPRLAFDGGAFGVLILTRLIREAPKFLKSDSFLCFEVGLGQGKGMSRLLENAKVYRDIQQVVDEAGNVRVMVAQT
jgi:release factor glutamine methyltransferase